jgi:hypothetical protein
MPRMSHIHLLLLLLLSLAMTSCTWTGKDGTHHSLVLGLGVISTKDTVKGDATMTQTSAVGLALLQSPVYTGFLLGYRSDVVTQIPPKWDGNFSLSMSPAHPLTIQSFPMTGTLKP